MNYIGSKYSLMDFLTETITGVCGTSTNMVFADLFAGTGVVGATFRRKGYTVAANDIQYYSYALLKHFIENPAGMDPSRFAYLNELPGVEGFVYNNYCAGGSGRNYFTDHNGRKCDAVRQEIERLRAFGEVSEGEYFWLLASLINSIDKYANTASVYGAYLKHVKSSAQREFKLELLEQIDGPKGAAFNEDINVLVKKVKGDILYLDPPYNARQYCANYHVLETIARYDAPELKGKTGLRDYTEQKSAFCSHKTAAQALDDLISNAEFEYVFLSYNNEGLIPIDTIREIMEKYGRYELFSTEYRRFKADTDEHRNHRSDKTIEYLHCLKK